MAAYAHDGRGGALGASVARLFPVSPPRRAQAARSLGARRRRRAAIDLNADAKRYTVDVVAGLSFGADVNTLETDDDLIHPHLEFAMAMLYRRVILPFPYWRLFRLPADRRLARSLAVITNATNGFIQAARARLAAKTRGIAEQFAHQRGVGDEMADARQRDHRADPRRRRAEQPDQRMRCDQQPAFPRTRAALGDIHRISTSTGLYLRFQYHSSVFRNP